jgi:hypothetical protein
MKLTHLHADAESFSSLRYSLTAVCNNPTFVTHVSGPRIYRRRVAVTDMSRHTTYLHARHHDNFLVFDGRTRGSRNQVSAYVFQVTWRFFFAYRFTQLVIL